MNDDDKIIELHELEKLAVISKKRKKDSRIIGIFSVISAAVGFSFAIYYILSLSNRQQVIMEMTSNQQIEVDSLLNVTESFEIKSTKQDSVKHLIIDFLSTIKDEEQIEKFYAKNVERYYLKKNVSIEQIKLDKRSHIEEKPRSKLTFEAEDIVLTERLNGTFEAFVNAIYYKDSLNDPVEIIYQIKVNDDYKVFYVRNIKPQ